MTEHDAPFEADPLDDTSVLKRIQSSLEDLIGQVSGLDVQAFLMDAQTREHWDRNAEGFAPPEQLIVVEDGEHVDLGLFLDENILSRLSEQNPYLALTGENLEAFLLALEGVSHFVLVAARGQSKRSVSAIELELQAEVDKFYETWRTLVNQGTSSTLAGRFALKQIFKNFKIEARNREEHERYRIASLSAEGYCRKMFKRHRSSPFAKPLQRSYRRFHRSSLASKLDHRRWLGKGF